MKAKENNINKKRNRLATPKARFKLTARILKDFISVKRYRRHNEKITHWLNISIGLSLSLLLIYLLFQVNFREAPDFDLTSNDKMVFEDLLDVPTTEHVNIPKPVIQQPQIREVSDEEIIEELEVDLDIEIQEETKLAAPVFLPAVEAEIPKEVADEIFTIVEEQPSPEGGLMSFYQFVSENMVYPSRAKRTGVQGRVFVQFVVEKDGALSDIQVVKGIGGGCDEEAVRVITSAPKWSPGKQRGKPVRVRMILPIHFVLKNS